MNSTESSNLTQQVHEKAKGIGSMVPDLAVTCEQSVKTVKQINKIHEKIHSQQQVTQKDIDNLRQLYPKSLAECNEQADEIRALLNKIYELRELRTERARIARHAGHKDAVRRGALMKMLQTSAQSIPMFMPKNIGEIRPLCGAVPPDPSYVAKPGDMVAALSRGKDGENWILAEVVSYNITSGRYELEDIDEEQKEKKLILSRRRIVPLPTLRANPVTNPESLFPKDTIVMALYPQTTCFYKGIIVTVPESVEEEYEVKFEDELSYPDGFSPPLRVAQRYVIPYHQPYSRHK